jgi:hypothetical protein
MTEKDVEPEILDADEKEDLERVVIQSGESFAETFLSMFERGSQPFLRSMPGQIH